MDHTNLKQRHTQLKSWVKHLFHFSGHMANVQEIDIIWIVCSQKHHYKCMISDGFVKGVILQGE